MAARSQRIQSLLNHNPLKTNLDSLDHALAWIMLTNDQLITHQHGGYGMYAGLPWFTEFPGAGYVYCLCRVQCFVQGSLIRHVIFLRHLHVIRIPFPHLLLTDVYLIV